MNTIGHVVGTENQPNTAYAFYFWAKRDAGLGIGSMVKVMLEDAVIYGTVVEAHAYNDLPNALADYLATQGRPGENAPTIRPEIRFFQAAVLRREPEEPVSAVGIGPVFEADAMDLRTALRADKFENGIPIGVYGSREKPMPVFADPDFLLGPEAGHLNVTGTSGLAAKTSYIQFVLQSIFEKFPGFGDEGVAAVLFNVKGGDLLFLDHETKSPLPEEHRAMYQICGLSAKPFDNVEYYAPFTDATRSEVKSLRNHPTLMESKATRGFCYGLKDVLKHAEVILNREDLDAKADSFLQFLSQEVAGKTDFRLDGNAEPMPATNLRELIAAVQAMLNMAEGSNSGFRTHHAATIRKMLNRLNGFAVRFPGLISDSGDAKKPLPDTFEDRTAYVIDVSQMNVEAQDLVFAAVISDLRERMEQARLGVKRLIVVVDELNKYAPSSGRETYVVQSLRDISARGRYLGLVLFSAQQFRSRVDAQVIGNSANAAYGHIQMEELANPIYTVYSQAVREKLATAAPGEMMIRHPHFSQPVFVRFPMPSIMRGNDGMALYPYSPETKIEDRIVALAIKLGNGNVSESKVRELLNELEPSARDESLHRICLELVSASADGKADPMGIIKKRGKRAPVMKEHSPPVTIIDDPFA